jgi:hypothetical protein
MDDAMMKAGGDAKRKELVALFGELNIDENRKNMTEEELRVARDGDERQAKLLTEQRLAK